MKKYIWAKDTPFSKKGDEVNIQNTSDSAYVFSGFRTGGQTLTIDNTTTLSFPELVDSGWIEEVNERWKPEIGGYYWFINSPVEQVYESFWTDHAVDRNRLAFGCVFKTREEANAAAEKVKALLLSLHE